MGEISIQQAVLTGSIKSSENLTCEIVPEGGVSAKTNIRERYPDN